MNIYVGNLPYEFSDDQLRTAFEQHGAVESARVIIDRYSGRSRGFGFVEMGNPTEGQAAITQMNGRELNGRPLTVNEARPRDDAGRGAGGGGGGDGQRY